MLWQSRRIDLHYRTDHDEVPLRSLSCDLIEQLNIEPLIDNAEEAKPRMRNVRLIFRIAQHLSCFAKMCGIDATRERMHRGVLITLHLIQTLPTSENQIDAPEQFLFH